MDLEELRKRGQHRRLNPPPTIDEVAAIKRNAEIAKRNAASNKRYADRLATQAVDEAQRAAEAARNKRVKKLVDVAARLKKMYNDARTLALSKPEVDMKEIERQLLIDTAQLDVEREDLKTAYRDKQITKAEYRDEFLLLGRLYD
jgi:hypothetical protein